MITRVFRSTGEDKPSYLDRSANYIAISINHGETIKFFPVRNHPKAEQNKKAVREYYNQNKEN